MICLKRRNRKFVNQKTSFDFKHFINFRISAPVEFAAFLQRGNTFLAALLLVDINAGNIGGRVLKQQSNTTTRITRNVTVKLSRLNLALKSLSGEQFPLKGFFIPPAAFNLSFNYRPCNPLINH